jgi:hypothetical protein
VISRLHPHFRRDFARLPRDIQQRARDAYRRFQVDPAHPGLQFKPLRDDPTELVSVGEEG